MALEQMQKIVDGAPEWANIYSVSDKCYYEDYAMYYDDILLCNLRTELAKREPMDLRAVDIPHGTVVIDK